MAAEVIKGSSTVQTVKPAQAADMEQFQSTPYYQGLGVEALEQQLAGYTTDEGALRQQVEAQYRPTYDAEVEALRQQLAQQVQGYNSQIQGAGASYDRQRRQTDEAYDQSAVELSNALNRRGLGRSSLVSTQGVYLEKQRNQALADIDRDESQAISAINERIALLTDQAAQSERTLAGSYARQLENRVNELKQQNQSAAIDLQLQIAALQQKGYEAYQEWLLKNREQELAEREFEIRYGDSSSGSSSSGGSKKSASSVSKAHSGGTGVLGTAGGVLGGVLGTLAGALKNVLSKNQAASDKTGGSLSGVRGTAGSGMKASNAAAAKHRTAAE